MTRKTRSDCTVGAFEKKHNLPAGTIRNKDGRDTRSDKLIGTIRKESKKKWFLKCSQIIGALWKKPPTIEGGFCIIQSQDTGLAAKSLFSTYYISQATISKAIPNKAKTTFKMIAINLNNAPKSLLSICFSSYNNLDLLFLNRRYLFSLV